MFWDSRATRSLGCLSNLGVEVESLSLSGFNLMVAIRSSVYIYDLRNCHESVQAKESFMDIQLKCVRPIHNFEGTAKIIYTNILIAMHGFHRMLYLNACDNII